jgi:hypothetical protein
MVRFALAAPAMGLFASAALAQTGTLDQSIPRTTAQFNVGVTSLVWQQQIRAGLSGTLEGIRVTLVNAPAGSHVNFAIRAGDAWATGPTLFTANVAKPTAGNDDIFIDMSASSIPCVAGQTFVVEIVGGESVWMLGNYIAPPGTPSYPEPLFLTGSNFADGGWRLGMDTYVTTGGAPCYPNCDSSTAPPILNVLDFNCFVNRFQSGDSYANCDHSTSAPVLNVLDFNCFINSFTAGCP